MIAIAFVIAAARALGQPEPAPPAPPPVALDDPSDPPAAPPLEAEPATTTATAAQVSPEEASAEPERPLDELARAVSFAADLITFYELSLREAGSETDWAHSFELDRLHVATELELDAAFARVLVEAARAGSEGALLGVAGDSVVLRLREAALGVEPFDGLVIRAGVVPTFTRPKTTRLGGVRAFSRTLLAEHDLYAAADLGVSATYSLPASLGEVFAGAFAGEGYTQRELNRGKDLEIGVDVRPLASVEGLAPLGVLASYQRGSRGVGSARTDRATGGLVWDARRIGGAAYFTYALGIEGDGSVEGWAAELVGHAEPIERFLIGVRAGHRRANNDAPALSITELAAAIGYRAAAPLEVLLSVRKHLPASGWRAVEPLSDALDVRVSARLVLDAEIAVGPERGSDEHPEGE